MVICEVLTIASNSFVDVLYMPYMFSFVVLFIGEAVHRMQIQPDPQIYNSLGRRQRVPGQNPHVKVSD